MKRRQIGARGKVERDFQARWDGQGCARDAGCICFRQRAPEVAFHQICHRFVPRRSAVARLAHFVHRRALMHRPKLWLALVMASAILSLAVGLRQSLGLFFVPMAVDLGVTGTTLGLAIALQNLLWGATQPFAGVLADRFGTGRVFFGGAFFYAIGLFYLARANDAAELYFAAGVLIPLG